MSFTRMMGRHVSALTVAATLMVAFGLQAETLRGQDVTLTTTAGTPLAISSVAGKDGQALFMGQPQPTWALVLKPAEGEPVVVNPLTAKLAGKATVSGGKLTMRWEPYAAPGGPITVSCTFEADQAEPLLRGRISVDNRSTCGLKEVQFPCLTLSATPAPAAETMLVFPRAYGRSWRNPFDAPHGFLVGTLEPYGHVNPELQMGALQDEGGRVLYWASYDGERRQKRYVLDNPPKTGLLHVKIGQLPENPLAPGADYVSPYAIVLGAPRGDWWDAARLYRRWALQQKWCQKGPLEQRTDVPQWIKEADVWVRGNGRYGLPAQRDYSRDLQKTFGGTIGIQYYNWTDKDNWSDPLRWPPTEGFPAFAAELAGEKIMVMPYVNSLQWDSACPTWRPEVAQAYILDEAGQPEAEEASGGTKPFMVCAATQLWRDTLVQSAVRLVKEAQVPGVYLDQLGNQGGVPCYNPAHGHPLGGGSYGTDGLRRICADIRTEIRKVNPQAAISGEQQGEGFIDVTDLRLNHYNNWPGWVNLWAAVYGDQIPTFGRTIVWRGALGEGSNFYADCGNTFVAGMQFGRLWPGRTTDWLSATGLEEQRRFFEQVLGLRRAGRKFLGYGWLQRPVRLLSDNPQLDVLDAKQRPMKSPAVLTSTWAAHDGTLGFVLCNTSSAALPVRWRADLSRHDIAQTPRYRLAWLRPDGSRVNCGELQGTMLERAEEMPAHAAVLLEVTPVP